VQPARDRRKRHIVDAADVYGRAHKAAQGRSRHTLDVFGQPDVQPLAELGVFGGAQRVAHAGGVAEDAVEKGGACGHQRDGAVSGGKGRTIVGCRFVRRGDLGDKALAEASDKVLFRFPCVPHCLHTPKICKSPITEQNI
jgi:hypothetical protein